MATYKLIERSLLALMLITVLYAVGLVAFFLYSLMSLSLQPTPAFAVPVLLVLAFTVFFSFLILRIVKLRQNVYIE